MKHEKISDAMNYLENDIIERADLVRENKINRKRNWMRWGAAAACTAIVVVSAFTLPQYFTENTNSPIEQVSPAADAPAGIRKFMNYNGYRYAFLENGATYNLTSDQLGDVLGTLEYDIKSDPENNSKKEFSTTFGLGGTVYQVATYDSRFRVAVELDGNYYICENVDTMDNTGFDLVEFFDWADFAENVSGIAIYDHAGRNSLGTILDKDVSKMIEILSNSKPAELTSEQYQEIGKAQKEGKSFVLSLQLSDSTQYELYVIPSLSLTMIGDNKYTMPEEFAAEFSDVFKDLAQDAIPMQ